MKRLRTDFITVTASNTQPTEDLTLKELDLRHRKAGWFECLHHFVIRRSGQIEKGRDYENHAMGLGTRLNALTVSICLVGGMGEPPFTIEQSSSLKDLVMELRQEYPEATLEFNTVIPEAVVTQLKGTIE